MAKATTIKDALKKLEETRGVNTAELEKVSNCMPVALHVQSIYAAHAQSMTTG
jgi:hypothetical protein